MAHGHIKEYHEGTGHGYIVSDEGGDDIPFERKDVIDGKAGRLTVGERVTYEVEGGLAGTAAIHVRLLSGKG